MNKIICELCGTSYSETAAQCPICGCARPADVQVVVDGEEQVVEQKHAPVKGGRFSKANVRKRNSVKNTETEAPVSEPAPKKEKQKDPDRGLVITVFALLLAIIAVIVYIVVEFFGPTLFPGKAVEETLPPPVVTVPTDPEIPCNQILLESTDLTFTQIGETLTLATLVEPINTTDEITYFSSDDAVVVVDGQGVVTAIGSGEAVVTVSCGDVSVPCNVVVVEPEENLVLNMEQILFALPGEQWLLYEGNIPMDQIVWASDDENIATIENGNVTAVSHGITTVYGNYNGETVSCVINCNFEPGAEGATEATDQPEATEPIVADNGPYQIKNLYGFSNSDATIRVGESFTLSLVDKDGAKVSGVTWTVENSECCSVDNGVVTGVAYGQTKVVATYGTEVHSFIVRVG